MWNLWQSVSVKLLGGVGLWIPIYLYVLLLLVKLCSELFLVEVLLCSMQCLLALSLWNITLSGSTQFGLLCVLVSESSASSLLRPWLVGL